MFHDLIRIWFEWIELWGYAGVFILMAMESSIIPVPSELVMPPAAFWALQGRMSFWGVVLTGTLGSYFGSVVSYWLANWVGHPICQKIFGKKLEVAERWIREYGVFGIFIARLLPVIRHLISIPAGIFRMPFGRFSAMTLIGAGLWCFVLAWFGEKILGDEPKLLESPEIMIEVIRDKMGWFVSLALVLTVLYAIVLLFRRKTY